MRELTQLGKSFHLKSRGWDILQCHESWYDLDPRPVQGDVVSIDGKQATIMGVEAFMTNPPKYGNHLSIAVTWNE